jgi:hypothetical protein
MTIPPPSPGLPHDKRIPLVANGDVAQTNSEQKEVDVSNALFLNAQPVVDSFRSSIDTGSNLSLYSADNENERRIGRPSCPTPQARLPSRSPAPPPKGWKGKWTWFWGQNKGLILVALSQVFGSLMSVTVRLLEEESSINPLQVCAPFFNNCTRLTCGI